MFKRLVFLVSVVGVGTFCVPARAADTLTKQQAAQALRRAVAFFRENVSASGGYLWRYSSDLTVREGEGQATASMAWVQPPGTPVVGQAFLDVYELTADKYYLEAARETAYALVRGQLRSGGWDYRIEFDPKLRSRYAYRAGKNRDGRNVTTLDDNNTQSALRFLMHVDRALEFQDKPIHECIEFALASLLKAQYPNGAWPQRYSEFPDPKQFPVKRASYPEQWSRTHPNTDYRSFYTFNDNTIADTIATMFEASKLYGETKYSNAAIKAGDFIILAQMPEPQPGWAQQYDADMHPAWARRFEPASITGGESRGVLNTLMNLYRETGDKRFLKPIPAALEYYKKLELPGGRIARFYELRTNKPLYFTKQYELTYRDDDLPTHYGFIMSSWVDRVANDYRRLIKIELQKLKKPKQTARQAQQMSPRLAAATQSLVDQMDNRGAWIEDGRLRAQAEQTRIITTQTFVNNIETLARFVAAKN